MNSFNELYSFMVNMLNILGDWAERIFTFFSTSIDIPLIGNATIFEFAFGSFFVVVLIGLIIKAIL